MPRYQQAQTFDIVRSVKGAQRAITQLQVQAPGVVRKSLNQITASLNPNSYFWGGDTEGWIGNNGTLVVVSDPPAPSPFPYAGLFTVANSGVNAAMEESGLPFLVVPPQSYLVASQIYTPTGTVVLGIAWTDGTGTLLSTSSSTISVASNAWAVVSAAFAAPAGAVYGYPRVAPADGVGNTIYATAITTQATTLGLLVSDTWHPVSLPGTGGFTGSIRVKLGPSANTATIDVQVQWTAITGTQYNCGNLPSAAYYPTTSVPRSYPISVGDNPNTMLLSRIVIPASGAIQIFTAASASGSGTGSYCGCTITYPLD
jgi:hypothetical protein